MAITTKRPGLFGGGAGEPPWNVEPWEIKPLPMPPTLTKKIEELMGDTAEQKAPSASASAVFSIERQKNGYIISVTGGGKWVCEDPDRLMDVLKMALADQRLV